MPIDPAPTSLLFLGVSGCSGSGKSTLAYILTLVYPDTILLQADDFRRSDHVPILSPPLNCPDSDSRYAIDFGAIYKVLDQIRSSGNLPNDYRSWFQENVMTIDEGQTRARDTLGGEASLEHLKALLNDSLSRVKSSTKLWCPPRLVILDGFVLYHDREIRRRLDVMLFLRLSKATAKTRRLARPAYVNDVKTGKYWSTAEYFEASVWKNYVREHSWLFVHGDVEGHGQQDVAVKERITLTPELDWSVQTTAEWAVEIVGQALGLCSPP